MRGMVKAPEGMRLGRQRLIAVVAAAVMFGLLPGVQQANGQVEGGLEVEPLSEGLSPDDLAQQLAGPGVAISNVTYSGASAAAGQFIGGTGIIGFESGIILSTGMVTDVVGPNGSDSTTTSYGNPGDTDLEVLINGPGCEESCLTTFDASVLEFDFTPDGDVVSFQYVFGSEEYNEFVGSGFDDVFAFFIDGVNCATVGEGDRVSINTINNGSNDELYIDNEMPEAFLNTELDGLTVVLTCTANVTPDETHHLKLAIADTGDDGYDSAVFLQSQSLVSGEVDLSVTKTTEASNVTVGDTVTYDITVTNSDDANATGVVVTDTLTGPGAIQPTEGCTVSEDKTSADCNIGALGASQFHQLTLTVLTTGPGTLDNSVQVTSNEADLNPADNEASASPVEVQEPPTTSVDLSIVKVDEPDPVTAGQNVAYHITVANNSDNDATGVAVFDDVNAGSILSGSGEGWQCGSFEGPFACFLSGDLAAGATAPLLTILVEAPIEPGTITQTASVTSNESDSNADDNTATEDTTVVESSEDGVTGFLQPGDTLVTDNGVTSPDNPISAQIIVPEGGTAGVYTLGEISDEAAVSKGAVEYTGPDPSQPFLIQVSCDESKCPLKETKDTFIHVLKENPDGTEQVLSACESNLKVKGKPTKVTSSPPCVVSVVRNALNAAFNPGDLVWTVKVFGADPIIKAR